MHEEVRRELRDSPLSVLASKKTLNGDADGIPVSLMTAMAAGVPVGSTQIVGILELVRHGETGCLAAPEDVGALVGTIEHASANSSS